MKNQEEGFVEESPIVEQPIKDIKKKKKSYKVVLVAPSWVMYDEGTGSLTWTSNVWKNIKKGDEITI